MKKIYFLCVLFISVFTVQAQSFVQNNLFYVVIDPGNSYVEVRNASATGIVTIPSTVVNGGTTYTVTKIANNAFWGNNNITSVIIPDSVTTIGLYAFRDCSSLTSVTIGNGVTIIDDLAFQGCVSIESIIIPDSVTTIDTGAFKDCFNLTSVTIPNSVTAIGEIAFDRCFDLTSVTFGEAVNSIGNNAFKDCTNLVNVTALNPTAITGSVYIFTTATYTNGTLYTAPGATGYDTTSPWSYFNNSALNIGSETTIEAKVFPNPVINTLNVQLQAGDAIKSIEVYNILGKKVATSTTNNVDMSTLTNGVYFATIITNNGRASKKIIK